MLTRWRLLKQIGWCAILGVCMAAPTAWAGLKEYVQQPDDSYHYELVNQTPLGPCQAYLVRMTSQTWRQIPWEHWLAIIVPPQVDHPDKAVLAIMGGNNDSDPPQVNSKEAQILGLVAAQARVPTAVLLQVPNQPLFDGLREDALIAYTFDRYLEEGDEDWPLLLPMVKSAVRAMDTVQSVLRQKHQWDVQSFIVTGASKRGWTTWLTASVDPRVQAIAPMVIDMLNLNEQMEHQIRSYGRISEKIHNYTDLGLIERLKTEAGQQLCAIVDPYHYRDLLTMPKLILLGTNDPYWTVDAANLYLTGLRGATYLHYEPNAGHGLGPGAIPALMGFIRSMVNEKSLPQLHWQHEPNGAFVVTWDRPQAEATLWTAKSPNRDFRQATWAAQPLEGSSRCQVNVPAPQSGYVAYYVQVSFPDAMGLRLSTPITVLPETMPATPAEGS
ncbi:MAG TPA: PhoPQ-activated protein PqaA family protein [Phycisphaeraceae bacterium]